ncbi:nuclear transport factor 2 family protein [Variovorax sp. J22R133]|uniref:nuclear transport factor 2 family protein n=1 Tax=Variovorax brevis TaxID=3053503 RepID=UPI0025771D97|nr:nuclear transport factor 2 family protein [Variovorax sp. J22R133]MDM0112016.1 nuclear transport factor 2 family protein [Variovorax sp. J22R133]
MSTPTEIAQQGYAAFGRGDVPGILELLADNVDWHFIGSDVPYAGHFVGKERVQEWFVALASSDEIQKLEPREFLEGPNHVTVIGWEQIRPLPNGKVFETDWVHVFVVKDNKVTRWIGTADTSARTKAAQ